MQRAPSEPAPIPRGRASGGFQRAVMARLSDDDITELLGVLDSQEQLPSINRRHDWARLGRFGLGPRVRGRGMRHRLGGPSDGRVRRAGGLSIGIDRNVRVLDVARSRTPAGRPVDWVDWVRGMAEGLPFPDASVDVVRCERVLQHLSDPQAAVTEFARVMRPGGRVAIVHATGGGPSAPSANRPR